MFSINRTQLICIIAAITLFILAFFAKKDTGALAIFSFTGIGFIGATFLLRTKTPPTPIIEATEEDTQPFPEATPEPETTSPPQQPIVQSQPRTVEEQLGSVLDNFFRTANVEGKVTLKLSMPSEINYRGQKVAVDSDIVVEMKGSPEPIRATQQPPTKAQRVEYRPIED